MNIWSSIAGIVGSITGTASLLAIIWGVAVWKGSIETEVKAIKECQTNYPPAESHLMAKTLWDLYIVGGLQNRSDLASHSSPFKLHEKTREMIPLNIRETLDEKVKTIEPNGHVPCLGYQVVKTIGEPDLLMLSKDLELSLQETISILVTYVSEGMPDSLKPGMVC